MIQANELSQGATPRSEGSTPRSGGITPRSGGTTPRSEGTTPRTGSALRADGMSDDGMKCLTTSWGLYLF